jgi:hypothetical protein
MQCLLYLKHNSLSYCLCVSSMYFRCLFNLFVSFLFLFPSVSFLFLPKHPLPSLNVHTVLDHLPISSEYEMRVVDFAKSLHRFNNSIKMLSWFFHLLTYLELILRLWVNFYNTTSSLLRFKDRNKCFYLEKRSSLLCTSMTLAQGLK